MKKITYSLLLALLFMMAAFSNAHARSSDMTSFRNTYPSAVGSAIDNCTLCHTNGNTSQRNAYANSYYSGGRRVSFASIESIDSDVDGFSNIAEINAKTYPGNAASKPGTTVNRPPVVDAGPSTYSVSSGGTITLTGSASDPDTGDTLTVAWTQSGTATGRFANAASATTVFTAPAVQASTVINLQLRATDKAGLSSTDTATVTVNPATDPNPDNAPPVADAGLDQMVLPGTINNLDGFYSIDLDDGIASYAWEQTGGPAVTLSDPSATNPVFEAPYSPATLTFRLVVTDKSGSQDSDTCTVVVLSSDGSAPPPVDPPPVPVNKPPVANAGQDISARSGSTVRLTGSASTDPDDGIASYQWRQISGTSVRLSQATSANASFRAPSVSSRGATLTFELTVKDKAGLSSSDTVTVSVSGSGDDDDEEDDD